MKTILRTLGLFGATALASGICAQGPAAPVARIAMGEPSLSADGRQIAFVSGGDIWEVSSVGGVARLLVSDPATEGRPLYSPDGHRLAFTSTRGGTANIYVLDLDTGHVTRITYADANEELDAWSRDGKWLYFASAVNDVARQPDIFRVAATGGTPLEVSRERYLSEFQASPSPDGGTIALVARGISNTQWWRNGHSHIDETEIWLKPVAEGSAYRRLATAPAKYAWPSWNADGRSLTVMSDRGGTENLWRIDVAGGAAPRALTRFTDGRLLYPSYAPNGQAVFERDLGIWRFDPATGVAAPVPITLRGATTSAGREHRSLSDFTGLALSPDGLKLALIAHGEVFAAPAKDGGVAQRITTSPGAESDVVWSPDSRRLLYVTERGNDQLLAERDVASGKEVLLTRRGVVSVPVYAPDGRSVAYVLDDRELHVVTVGTGALVDRTLFTGALAVDEDAAHPVWSPDGRMIAVPVRDRRSFVNVHVVPVAGGEARPVSFLANGLMGAIAWSPDGRYILFDTSQRSEESRIVRVDLLPHVPKYREDVFNGLFQPSTPPGAPAAPPAPVPATEAPSTPLPTRRSTARPTLAATPVVPVTRIDWDGLRDRATTLPLGLNARSPLITPDGKTLVFRAAERGQENFYSYDLDELATEPPVARQLTATGKSKGDAALSADGKALVYLDGGTPVSTPIDTPKPKPVAVTAEMDVDFDVEKLVVFDEAWNALDRHFFDPAFTGHDWKALRARFRPYAAGARTPDELRRIINLMIGELNASHSGINRPWRGPGATPTDRVGDLGLRFDRAAYEAGRGLIVREIVTLGPAAVEQGIKVGDRLLAVNDVPIVADTNLDALLEHQVGDRIRVTVSGPTGRRDVTLRPVSTAVAGGLLYRQWVASRRALVDRWSGGRLGYVHIADMSEESLSQLYLDLDAANQAKAGVVVDIRHNDGGFVNGYALDVFSRPNYLTMTPRGLFPVPSRQALGQRALGKPTILVIDESSLSDAEDFTEGYRKLGLGKVVGQPTAGWIIYTSGITLLDGSVLRVPHTRIQDAAGRDMEMAPRPVDIAVDRPLGETGTDRDRQLAMAVEVLLRQSGVIDTTP